MNSYLELPIAAVLGLLAPLVVSILKQANCPPQLKMLTAFAVSVVFGLIAVFATGDLDPVNYLQSAATVFTVSNLFYEAYFKYTALNAKLEDYGSDHAASVKSGDAPDELDNEHKV